MKKYMMIVIILLLIIVFTSSMTYAWFTYVQRKSVATFDSNELLVDVTLNDEVVTQSKNLKNLAFIDFNEDLLLNTNQAFNEVGQVVEFKITLGEQSPLSRYVIDFNITDPALIYIIIGDELITDYHLYINQIINPLDTKEAILNDITLHNSNLLSSLESKIMLPGETQTFKIIFWGDYDALVSPENYLSYQANITVDLTIVNAYGDYS